MVNEPINETMITEKRIDRRRVVRTGGLAAGMAALLAAPSLTRAAAAQNAEEAEWDVALDGATIRYVRATPGHPSGLPLTGDQFIMFGSIFPAGTFETGNLNPDQPGAVGRWVCRGAFYVDLTTEEVPHGVTTVMHVLGEGLSSTGGPIGAAHDTIVHEGFEGGLAESRRSIVGGVGKYAGVSGEVIQVTRGMNDSLIQITPEIAVPAPSYTFRFQFAKS